MATIPVEVSRIQGLSSACLLLLQSSSVIHVPMCALSHTHTHTHTHSPLPRSRKMSLSCISVCLITSATRSNEVSPYTCNHRTAIIHSFIPITHAHVSRYISLREVGYARGCASCGDGVDVYVEIFARNPVHRRPRVQSRVQSPAFTTTLYGKSYYSAYELRLTYQQFAGYTGQKPVQRRRLWCGQFKKKAHS